MPFRAPGSPLPLTPLDFEILLVLAGIDAHGYAILQAVESRMRGRLPLRTGTLYRALARLGESGFIRELDEPGAGPAPRRRVYRLTPPGRTVLRAEAERLADQVDAARSRRLLPSNRP
jgi:DNA-binding PadR family transcriptional regulator